VSVTYESPGFDSVLDTLLLSTAGYVRCLLMATWGGGGGVMVTWQSRLICFLCARTSGTRDGGKGESGGRGIAQ